MGTSDWWGNGELVLNGIRGINGYRVSILRDAEIYGDGWLHMMNIFYTSDLSSQKQLRWLGFMLYVCKHNNNSNNELGEKMQWGHSHFLEAQCQHLICFLSPSSLSSWSLEPEVGRKAYVFNLFWEVSADNSSPSWFMNPDKSQIQGHSVKAHTGNQQIQGQIGLNACQNVKGEYI